MSYRHSNAIREILIGEFDSHTQRYILIELAHLADNAGVLRYSQQDLADVIGLSRITVAREINLLIEKGLVLKGSRQGLYKVAIQPTGPAIKDTGRSDKQPETDSLTQWLREKEDEGGVFEAEFQEYDEGKQVLILQGERLPECVNQAMNTGKLRYAFPAEGGTIYAICFEY